MTNRRALLWLMVAFAALHVAALLAIGPDAPPRDDETHFIPTARQFAAAPTLQTLRTYNEMSGPLPFIFYAAWGAVFGFAPLSLRLAAMLIAAGSYIAIFRFLRDGTRNAKAALALCMLLMLNPYMIALSVLAYTDMPAIGLSALFCWAFMRGRALLAGVALAAALLCRQHAVCYLLAGLIAAFPAKRALLAACGLAIFPLLALMCFWRGPAPDNAMRASYDTLALAWHPSSAILYIAVLAIYLAPLVAWRWRAIYAPRRSLLALPFAAVYFLFPVRTSPAAERYGAHVVGFVDRAAQWITPCQAGRDIIFGLAFLVGIPTLLAIIAFRKPANRLFNTVVISFLLIMPFAYMHWEKYITLILPLAALRVWQLGSEPAEGAIAP